jgi:PIN domain nuclease of toxin-antitoxin system
MVTHLLDTSTLLWTLAAPERLSTAARETIAAGGFRLSVASYWEVVIKARKGLLDIPDPVNWWGRVTELLGVEVLPIRATHISALAMLPGLHRDPFDRILIAQAVAEGWALVTADARIREYPVQVVW